MKYKKKEGLRITSIFINHYKNDIYCITGNFKRICENTKKLFSYRNIYILKLIMTKSEINQYVLDGYVPISVSIYYDKVNKRYNKQPINKGWENTNIESCISSIDYSKDVGILTGSKYNLLVIDIDVKDKGLETWNKWIDEYGIDDDTVIAKTPTGGYHYYFTCSDEIAALYKTSRKSFICDGERVGIDIRSNGGFIVVPPSKQGEKKYSWVNSLKDNLLADVPEWLQQFLAPTQNNFSYNNIINMNVGNDKNIIQKILEFSEKELGEHFNEVNKGLFRVSYNTNSDGGESKLKSIFEWDDKLKIYKSISKFSLGNSIVNYYSKFKSEYNIEDLFDDKDKMREFKKYTTLLRNLGSKNKVLNIASFSIESLITNTENFGDDKEKNTHLLNFRNGCYDLIKNEFRQRTKDDCVSIYLNYDYKESQNKYINKVKDIIRSISNDDEETLGFMLNYLGYCLTGETRAKKFLILYGASASNGKTTLQEIFSKCLNVYSYKIDRETFNYKYDKFHKQLIQCQRPKRMVFLEEMNKNKLDISKLKEFVDGNDINCNIMYGTSDLVKISSKLIIATNNSPVFDTDNGIQRRGLILECKNRFVDKKDYEKLKGRKGIYLKDERIMDLFDDNTYRLAFINLLIPHAVKYYKEGLIVPDEINNAFKELCEENDTMKSFINDQFEITNNDSDRIGKDEFVSMYNERFRLKLRFRQLLSDIKRLGIEYNRQKRHNGKKGCLIGIKYKSIYEDTNYDDNDMSI
jgi:P4 family phage/plasmid primase-like protien